jgi:hypothetical protein
MQLHPQIRPGDRQEANRIDQALIKFGNTEPLPGLGSNRVREVLVVQLIESLRRNRYISHVRVAEPSERVLGIDSAVFDPLMGATLRGRAGNFDDACWLIFLSVHFGRHKNHRWALAGRFYNRLGQRGLWDWDSLRTDVEGVRTWLDANKQALKEGGVGFGNHRKYESLSGTGTIGTGETLESYVEWVGDSHSERFSLANSHMSDPDFGSLFDSLSVVNRFGRTARFDYLALLGKLGLVNIQPDRAYLGGSTGPLAGARLLFAGSRTAPAVPADLEMRLARLQEVLQLPFDVLEDALCNWQKSPAVFIAFRG